MKRSFCSFIVLLLALPFFSLQAQEIIGEYEHLRLVETKEVILQENVQFFNHIGGMTVLDSVILVSTYNPPVVILYNMSGKQSGLVSEQGRGPHEFLMPTIISSNGNNFLVWDAVQLKFTEVGTDGKPGNEYTGIKQAIGKFAFIDGKLIVYNKGRIDGSLISIFQINGTQLEKIEDIDGLNEDHKKLTRYGDTAPFAVKNETIYYGRADESRFYSYNLNTKKKNEINFIDKNFNVEETSFSMNDRSDKADDDWINFIYTNSRFKNIYTLNNYLVAEIQNGNNFNKSRETVFHIFDYDLNKIDELRMGYNSMLSFGDGAKIGNKNELIFYKDYPDMSNNSGNYERGQEYLEKGGHHLRKLTFFQLIQN